MAERKNDEWLTALGQPGDERDLAIEDLRGYLTTGLRYALASRANVSQADLDDFAQDAILRILGALSTFRGDSRFTTWAQKIAVRVAFSELRHRRWKDVPLETTMEGRDGEFIPELAADTAAGPEQLSLQEMAAAVLRETIANELTDNQRDALVAIVLKGMPLEEVARKMGRNRNALYKLLHDARKRLKQRLQESGLAADEIMAVFETETA